MANCGRCDYILAARQVVNLSKLMDANVIEKVVQDFISNKITFYDMAIKLELTEGDILSIIPDRELWNRRIDDA